MCFLCISARLTASRLSTSCTLPHVSTNTRPENGLCFQRSVFTSGKLPVTKCRCVYVDVRLIMMLFVYLFHCLTVCLSTARPDTPVLSSQLWHESRPRAELSVELWSEATKIRRQENTASAHAQERSKYIVNYGHSQIYQVQNRV